MFFSSLLTVRKVRADRWVTRLVWLTALAAMTESLGSPTESAHAQAVVPIDWNRFSPASTLDPFAQDVKAFLNNSARYNVNWVAQRYPSVTSTETTTGRRYDMQSSSEGEIRSIGHTAYGIAAMLKTGAVDPAVAGISPATLADRTMEMIHGAALEHKANGAGVQWGNTWQSALWAADVAESAWMMWDQLPAATRGYVTNMTVYEANRFVNYDVPYWSNPDGTRNFPGDTKAEENAWNSRILAVAVGMMPQHPNSSAWRNKASELLVSSFSRPSDLQNGDVLDGQPVAAWLDGYNAYQSGFVDNHGLLHNDYLGTTDFTIYPYITQSLAGQAVPQTVGFNFPIVYNAMATTPVGAQDRPMFQRTADGGYIAEQYYPDGTDWSVHRHDVFLQLDAFAETFGVDAGAAYDAAGWGRARLDRMLQMQSRHSDGRLYAPGEFDSWLPKEAYALEVMSRVWMVDWLDKQDALNAPSNWNASLAPQAPAYLKLQVNRTTGEMTLLNSADVTSVELAGYAVRSIGGQLAPNAWTTLSAQGVAGWITANPSDNQLGELSSASPLPVAPGISIDLGPAYAPPAPTSFGVRTPGDLQFEYLNADGDILTGDVQYVGAARNETLLLVVDPQSGLAEIRNETPFSVSLEGYVVKSTSGALRPENGAWNSLSDQGDHGIWIEANPDNRLLAELIALEGAMLTPDASLELGRLFNTVGQQDLSFEFLLDDDGPSFLGAVVYEPLGLPGDFNVDGVTDGMDILQWQRELGVSLGVSSLGNWKSHFGQRLGSMTAAASLVPEASSLCMILAGACGSCALLRSRRLLQ
jgi:hypothetical protein